jgi:hypothetical protein
MHGLELTGLIIDCHGIKEGNLLLVTEISPVILGMWLDTMTSE